MKKQSLFSLHRGAGLLSMMVFSLAFLYVGCTGSSDPEVVRIEGKTMGTFYQVSFNELPKGENLITLKGKIEKILKRVNGLMSTWQEDSELMQFNQQESTDWFEVSPEVVQVVQEAQRISKLSDGAFDVTVGPLIKQWNFDVPQEEFSLPTEEQLEAVSEFIGYQLVETREFPPALKKQHPQVFVNLSAIAKGFGVDRVGAVMEHVEVSDYFINIGGETLARGSKPDGKPWKVGIEKPAEDAGSAPQLLKGLPLNNQAMATSGNYRNYYLAADGRKYSHTIDPRTKKPVGHRLLSVSVLAKTCMTADALATAIMVMGPEEAGRFAEQNQLAVYLVYEQEGGEQFEQASSAFKAYEQENSLTKAE